MSLLAYDRISRRLDMVSAKEELDNFIRDFNEPPVNIKIRRIGSRKRVRSGTLKSPPMSKFQTVNISYMFGTGDSSVTYTFTFTDKVITIKIPRDLDVVRSLLDNIAQLFSPIQEGYHDEDDDDDDEEFVFARPTRWS
jgi:hypothetical protein